MPKKITNKKLLAMVDTSKLGRGAKITIKKTPKKKVKKKK